MRDLGAVTRVAGLAVAVGLAVAACTSGPSRSQSPRSRSSTVSAVAHPLSTKLHQQTGPRFVKNRNGANPAALTVLESSRNLRPGQQGAVLTVRGVGYLLGSCRPGHPAVKFRVTYRGPGWPLPVTEVREPLARPVSLYLSGGLPGPSPVGGKQQFAFIQILGGGESADFSLVLWATLTPLAGGCAFSVNGVLRVRGSDFLQRLG